MFLNNELILHTEYRQVLVNNQCVLQGLLSNLILGKDVLTDWKIYPLDIDGAITGGWPHSHGQQSFPMPQTEPTFGPAFYVGTLEPNGLAQDTFLRLNEWTKVTPVLYFPGMKLPMFSLMLTCCFNVRARFGSMV